MDKSIEFKRQGSEIIKSIVAPIIEKRLSMRGDTPEIVKGMLRSLALTSPVTPEQVEVPAVLTDTIVNSILDAMFLDYAILYTDLFRIQDEITNIQRMFDEHIGSLMMRLETIATEANSLSNTVQTGLSFSRSFHRTPVAEGTTNGFYGVSINSAARRYRLASVSTNYASEQQTKVSVQLLSDEANIIMTGDPKKAFGGNILDPYYIIINSDNEPVNRNFYSADFSDELGVIVSLVFRFSTIVPVSRIRIQPFANAPVEVLGVYTSESPGAQWGTSVFQLVSNEPIRMVQTSREIELTFPRTYASEFHVIIRLHQFITVAEDSAVHPLDIHDYLTYAATMLERACAGGFSTRSDENNIVELVKSVKKEIMIPEIPVRAGTRLYVLGISSVIIENTSYQIYGMHESSSELVHEIPIRAAMLFDGNPSLEDPDFVTLGFIRYGNKTTMIAPLGDTTVVNDAIINPYQGDPDTYIFPLNFIVDPNYTLIVRYGGKEAAIAPSDLYNMVYTAGDTSTLYVPRNVLEELELMNGVPIAFRYTTPSLTVHGTPYTPDIININDIIGQVTVDQKCKPFVTDRSIYVTIPSGETNYWIQFSENEYNRVSVSGEPYFLLSTNKGYSGEPLITYGDSTWIVPESTVCGPFGGVFRAVIDEPVSLTLVGSGTVSTKYQCQTEYPYALGSVVAFINDYVTPVEEYGSDSSGFIATNNDRRKLTVVMDNIRLSKEGGINSAKVSYIPLPDDSSAQSAIKPHNAHEEFILTNSTSISLKNPSYADSKIIREATDGGEFLVTDYNVFYLKRDLRITYEPVIVYVNGIKCYNTTDYTGEGRTLSEITGSVPTFSVDPSDHRQIVFDRPITGRVTVDYYTIPQTLTGGFVFFHTNPFRESESPYIQWYDVLVDTV